MFVTISQNVLNLAICPRPFLNFPNFVTYKRKQFDEKLLAHFSQNKPYQEFYYCRPLGWLYSPVIWEIEIRNNLPIFDGFYISSILYTDFLNFSENRDKEFQLGSRLFQFCMAGNFMYKSESWRFYSK